VVGPTLPDLTLILDLPAEEGLHRARTRAEASGEGTDHFEGKSLRFHENLRSEFHAIAAAEPERCALIDARRPVEDVAHAIWAVVVERLAV
jgi:dTMP kinase